MELYLVQHGEALSEREDPERPLSPRGSEEVRRVAVAAARAGLRPAEIRHSGKRRAAQTAEIFAAALGKPPVIAVGGMAPNDDVHALIPTFASAPKALMLVGHLPFLSRLANLLLVGDPERTLVRFRMGGILCLTADVPAVAMGPGGWTVAWMLTPEVA